MRKLIVVTVLVGLLSQAALAKDTTTRKESDHWGDAGYGMLALVSNLFYMPAKLVYATLGTVTGGLAYVLTVGDADTAGKIWAPSVGGSYVITPGMLRGDEDIFFNGASSSND